MSETARPAWAEIDLGAVRHNVERVRSRLSPGTRYMAVVKANAYGHGDVECARAALDAGAAWLGVALVDEGVRLRAAGIDAPILLLHEPPPHRAAEVLRHRLTPCVFTEAGLAGLADAAERAGEVVRAHLKVDTGMNRLGVPVAALEEFLTALAKESRVEIEGVFSHFAYADDPGNPFIDEQVHRFAEVCERLARAGLEPPLRHLANSAAALTRPETHLDLARVGIATYGLSPGPKLDGIVSLEPAMSLKARVAMVKRAPAGSGVSYGLRYRLPAEATLATIPLGYADGWPRGLANRASVLIHGRRYPAVGTVCMDSFVADLGDDDCEVGDEVVLVGAQGGERVAVEEIAGALGTINYEVVAQVSARVPRVFRG